MKRLSLAVSFVLCSAVSAQASPHYASHGHKTHGHSINGGEVNFRNIKNTNGSSAPSQRRVSSVYSADNPDYIARDDAAKKQFMSQSGYPQGRPGYSVMYVIPLRDGGLDAPSNMRWRKVPGGTPDKDAAKKPKTP